MKKRLLFCLMAGLACGGFFTSCSDDDDPTTDEVVICPIAQTTYTDASGLVLTYSGQPVLGKQVVFTPDANDGSKATLTISGVLDLSSFTGLMNSRENASLTSPFRVMKFLSKELRNRTVVRLLTMVLPAKEA